MPTNRHWLLRVDLSKGTFTRQEMPFEWFELYLGGKALGFYLALKEGLVTADPLSPENKLYILPGPLTGFVAGGGATALVTKSPSSYTLTDPIAQSNLGYSIKSAGFDGLVIEGAASRPVYLAISDTYLAMLPAQELWGTPCSHVYHELRNTHPEITNSSTIAIGQAGEHLVRFAAAMVDTRAFGRGGAGAVFGSKNLKGIIIGGISFPEAFDRSILDNQHQLLRSYIYSDKHPYQGYQNEGTSSVYRKHVHTGCMSGWNYRKFNYEDPSLLKLGDAIVHLFTKDPSVCFKCYLSCARYGIIQSGQFAGQQSNGPEFETVWAFGPQCANNVVDVIVEADLLCDELGMDTLSAGNVIGFYFECLERGFLVQRDDKRDVVETLHKIAYREGYGDLLAEGVKRAGEIVGSGATAIAMHVKGLEIPAYDPRGFAGIGLAYAVSSRGGCHRKAFCPEEAKGEVDGALLEGKPQMVITEEHKAAYRDSMVVCKWGSAGQEIPYYPDAIYGAIGLRLTSDDILQIGCKAVNMARMFNVAQGYSRKDDTLPARLFDETKSSGPLTGKRVDRQQLEQLKTEYYKLRGWTDDGVPTAETLHRLGLDEFLS